RFFARLESIEAVQLRNGRTIDFPIRIQNIDDWKVMALSNLEIEYVMGGRNFQNACAELGIDRFVGDDRKFFARERTTSIFADQTNEHPSRFSCSMMMLPCLFCQSTMRRRNSSRPRSWRVTPSFLRSHFSTAVWVAIPA